MNKNISIILLSFNTLFIFSGCSTTNKQIKEPTYFNKKQLSSVVKIEDMNFNKNKISFNEKTKSELDFSTVKNLKDNNEENPSYINKYQFRNNISTIDKENMYNKNYDYSNIKYLNKNKFDNDQNVQTNEKYLGYEDFYYNKDKDKIKFDETKQLNGKFFQTEFENDKKEKEKDTLYSYTMAILSLPFKIGEILFIPFENMIDNKYDNETHNVIKSVKKENIDKRIESLE